MLLLTLTRPKQYRQGSDMPGFWFEGSLGRARPDEKPLLHGLDRLSPGLISDSSCPLIPVLRSPDKAVACLVSGSKASWAVSAYPTRNPGCMAWISCHQG